MEGARETLQVRQAFASHRAEAIASAKKVAALLAELEENEDDRTKIRLGDFC